LHISLHPGGLSANAIGDDDVGIITRIQMSRQGKFFQIVEATDGGRVLLGGRQNWQEQCRQNGNDGDDHQKFKQGEGAPLSASHAGTYGFHIPWPDSPLFALLSTLRIEFATERVWQKIRVHFVVVFASARTMTTDQFCTVNAR
jgi:hypothetical protein